MHGTGPDAPVVGHHRAERRLVLDPAEEVVVGGVGLEDHGRARAPVVGDQDVRRVAAEELLAGAPQAVGDRLGQPLVSVVAAAEAVEVLDDVVGEPPEPAVERRHVGEPPAEVLDEVTDREEGDLAVELAQPAHALTLDVADPRHDAREARLDLVAVLQQLAFGRLGQLLELGRGDEATVDDRHGHEAGGRELERQAALEREPAQLGERVLAAFLQLALELVAALLVVLALERLRDPAQRVVDEPAHPDGELLPLPGRQGDRPRPLGRLEVEEVHAVARCGATRGPLGEQRLHRRAPPGPHRPR